ncbi:hypothetical protein RS584_12695 [Enterobacter sp. DTU_2021_1002640_1_SI_PRY_ASU_LCPMC_013]|uniref:hypothetical protein n=1 Tax=Enterobacter TaxID=547 RepID=UPI000760324F|nr:MULTISPECIES: hypothetical protein [Enterobacter]MBG0552699.1 hypothetical protein [Enterobacter hormaechei]WNU98600.1 hypothetical protein RS584_12695 [Enterobacter sp. DTU_2021_1002640_1_SI_PRY_ASU_LCPMC_013]DAI82886.1 MAG TPA: hypothetical protein [Caudoviricetes sp.]
MDTKEWVGGLRWLSDEQIVDLHFKLQEKIKEHYKQRDVGDNLERAIQFCEQHVALAELAFPALKAKHNKQAAEYEALTGNKYPAEFYAPAHHGYRQLITIMKKRKQLVKVAELEAKRRSEGWRE